MIAWLHRVTPTTMRKRLSKAMATLEEQVAAFNHGDPSLSYRLDLE